MCESHYGKSGVCGTDGGHKDLDLDQLVDLGVIRCGKGVVHLMSLGHPPDIGLQLGKACNPCSR